MSKRTPHIIEIPYGHPRRETIYINNVESNDWIAYKFQKRLNRMGLFEIEMLGISSSDQTNIAEGKEVMFFIEDNLKFKGIITRVEYETEYSCMVYGYGMEVKLTYQQTSRTEYTNTATSTIVSAIASDIGLTEGTNTNWGNINIRNEHDTYLTMIKNLSEFTGYDWWISHTYPFTNNILNFDTRRGSASPTFTFTTGSNHNCYTVNLSKEEVINHVVVLGYGDGVNQISTSFYDATPVNSTLVSDIDDDDTGLVLADGSDFDLTGEIIIAEERMTYTRLNDNFTVVRGCNGTTAKAHPKGVYVAKYVAPTEAASESGSSIKDNGLRKRVFVDKSLVSDKSAQMYASKILTDYKDSFERLVIRPTDITEPTCVLGDAVTVTDADTGVSGNYRVVGEEYYYNIDTGEMLLYELSNYRVSMSSQIGELNKGTKIPSSYAQGATNCYMTGETENCDSSHGLRIDFFIPDEAINVNSIKLNYRLSKYRVWGTTAASATHTHTGLTTASSDTTEYTNEMRRDYDGNKTHDCGVSSLTYHADIPFAASGSFAGCVITVSINNESGSNDTYDWTLTNDTKSTTLHTESNWSINDNAGKTKNLKFDTDDVSAGDRLGLEITDGVLGTENDNEDLGSISLKIQTNATHSHSLDISASGSHTHSITYGISEGTYTANDIVIKVDGVDKTSDIETAKGSALNSGDGETENGSHMELKDYLSGTIAGAWHYIEINPNGNCRVTADLFTQIFIESKVL